MPTLLPPSRMSYAVNPPAKPHGQARRELPLDAQRAVTVAWLASRLRNEIRIGVVRGVRPQIGQGMSERGKALIEDDGGIELLVGRDLRPFGAEPLRTERA